MNPSRTSNTARQIAAPGWGPILDPPSRALADAFWGTRFNRQFPSVVPDRFSNNERPHAQHISDCLEGSNIQRPSSLTRGQRLRLAMVHGQNLQWHAEHEQSLRDRAQPWLAPGGPLPFPEDYTPPPLPDEEPEEVAQIDPSTDEQVRTWLGEVLELIEEPGNTLPDTGDQATSLSAETINATVEGRPDSSSRLPAERDAGKENVVLRLLSRGLEECCLL